MHNPTFGCTIAILGLFGFICFKGRRFSRSFHFLTRDIAQICVLEILLLRLNKCCIKTTCKETQNRKKKKKEQPLVPSGKQVHEVEWRGEPYVDLIPYCGV